MNFRTASTPEKLRFLADHIIAHSMIFQQCGTTACTVGLGLRLQGNGSLTRAKPRRKHRVYQMPAVSPSYTEQFAVRFGITEVESIGLFLSNYSQLKIRMKDADFLVLVTPEIAATALRRLADKYERRGTRVA